MRSSMSLALTVESVSKHFRVGGDHPTSFKEWLVWRMTGRHRRNGALWALRDVTFSVEQGRALGIIGHNGAGKSTLLRLLCGLGRPTTGRIHHTGSVSGLLELGSGFHHDMTGRENILTAGILNGLTKKQILAEQGKIIEFSELDEFIDQPVRTYSSGMFVRLAFSTAIHFDPDVLMIDEVLAVGDSRFQQKCLDRLNVFRNKGKTLVLVSHDTELIRSLCDEVLVLEEGRVAAQGDPESAIRCYHDLMRQRTEKRASEVWSGETHPNLSIERGRRLGTHEATIDAVHLLDGTGRDIYTFLSGEEVNIVLQYSVTTALSDMALILGIYSETNVKCFETTVPSARAAFGNLSAEGKLCCRLPKLPLLSGRYYIDIGLYPTDWNYLYDYHWHIHVLNVETPNGTPPGVSGVIFVTPVWSIPA